MINGVSWAIYKGEIDFFEFEWKCLMFIFELIKSFEVKEFDF